MTNHYRSIVLVAVFASAQPLAQAQPSTPAGDPAASPSVRARVVLRGNVTVSETAVCVGTIADIQTSDSELRQRLAGLDLVELPLSGPPTLISRSQVSFRLQLAGLDPAQIRLQGPELVQVSLTPQERLEGRIEAAARQALLEKIGSKESDLSIQLAQRITLPAFKESPGSVQLEVESVGRPPLPGRAWVNVSVFVRNAQRLTLTVYFNVKPIESVYVGLRTIAAGEVLTDKNVRMERVALDRPMKPGGSEQILGRRARRVLPVGQPIAPEDVEAATAPSPVLIHQHDVVNLVVRSGALQVTARGQAMEDGRADQSIRVRNVDSNTIVTGRVVDRSVVEVDLLRTQP